MKKIFLNKQKMVVKLKKSKETDRTESFVFLLYKKTLETGFVLF